jgi:branched chain amino acid efflux pump
VRARWIPVRYAEGMRAGLPLAAAGLLLGISFGVIAKPLMGSVAPIVMSAIAFALTPVAPPGVPVLAACAGALLGAWQP